MKIVALLRKVADRIARTSSFRITLLAVLSAMVVGAFIIILSDINKLQNGDILGATKTVGSAYWALVVGSVGSLRAISAKPGWSAMRLMVCGLNLNA